MEMNWLQLGEVGRGHPLVDAATELAAMGIKLSSSLVPQSGMSPAMELQVTRGIHVDRESVNRAVEDRASDAGNVAKLRAAPHATARHLFVPMYPAAPMVWAVEYIEPTSTPVLPPEVTRAWVVGGANDVLYVEPPNDWDRVPYDSRAMSDPERWKARRSCGFPSLASRLPMRNPLAQDAEKAHTGFEPVPPP